jgi:hypothetical protein
LDVLGLVHPAIRNVQLRHLNGVPFCEGSRPLVLLDREDVVVRSPANLVLHPGAFLLKEATKFPAIEKEL